MHNDIQHNDTRHNDIQLNDTQHKNKYHVRLSIMPQDNVMLVSFMLSVTYKPSIMSVITQKAVMLKFLFGISIDVYSVISNSTILSHWFRYR